MITRIITNAVLTGAAFVSFGGVLAAQNGLAVPSAPLAREILAEMIPHRTLDTGSTTPLVESLAARFRAAGFPAGDVLVVGPERNRNLVVRLRGRTTARLPILFLAHLDVVDAEPSLWTTNPWQLVERDGLLWGRGVSDDKGPAATIAAAFLHSKSTGFVPERDLVMALTAGEESGVDNGVEWLIANRPELVRAEYVINADGGGGELENDQPVAFNVQAAEKVYLDLTLTVRGPGGHSSLPDGVNPIERLAAGIARLSQVQFPEHITPVTREYLAVRKPASAAALNALVRTTCITTLLDAGTAPNAIPALATANVNCRVIPGEQQAQVIETLRRALNDSSIVISVRYPMKPSDPSVMSPALRATLESLIAELYGAQPVVPYMEMGATDGVYLRNAGIPVFGIIGLYIPADMANSIHGNDERITAFGFDRSAEFMRRLLLRVGR